MSPRPMLWSLCAFLAALAACGSGLERATTADTRADIGDAADDLDLGPGDLTEDTAVAPDGADTAPDMVEPEVDTSAPDDALVDTADTGADTDTAPAGPCDGLEDEAPCDDGNACTLDERCLAGRCTATAPRPCDDDNPCTDDTCLPDVGCVFLNNLGLCDDGDPCTARDRCAGGLCRPGTFACDDGNPCTRDACGEGGACSHTPDDTLTCEDGSACTAGDFCAAGFCMSGPLDGCAESSQCVASACAADGLTCVVENLDGERCDDGDACTGGDACLGGLCRGGPAIRCPWDSECAVFRCDRRDGCILDTPLTAGRNCSDDDRCTTGDKCDGTGFCIPTGAAACDDLNPCTLDGCDPIWGCTHESVSGPCDDGSLCTLADACQFGQCRGTARVCNDDDACTADSCDPLLGCQFLRVSCDDGNPCTADTCDRQLGCRHVPTAGVCDDGLACTVGDACLGGVCVGLSTCDDGDACTLDVCDRLEGCVSAARTPCPVGRVKISAVGVGAPASPGAGPGFGQWLALTNDGDTAFTLGGWMVAGTACDCEARLSGGTLQPGATAYGLRASDPLPTPTQLAPGGPATLAGFMFQFGEVGDETFFVTGDTLELIDETGAVVMTFQVP